MADCLGPLDLDSPRAQGDFDRLVKLFGLEDKDDQGKVDGLRAVPYEKFVAEIKDPYTVYYPVV